MVSFIVPTYNAQDKIANCIESILGQTEPNLELILVDDGSTDRSGRICDECATSDNRIRVFHRANGGASDARNFGLAQARGKWIAFCDADDYYDRNFIKSMLTSSKKNAAIYISGITTEYLNLSCLCQDHYAAAFNGEINDFLSAFAGYRIPIMLFGSLCGMFIVMIIFLWIDYYFSRIVIFFHP